MLPESFYEYRINMIPKPDKNATTKRKNYIPTSLINLDANVDDKIKSIKLFEFDRPNSIAKRKYNSP